MSGLRIRAIVYPEEGKWVAQCLEHDILATGETFEELRDGLAMVIKDELEQCERIGVSLADAIPPAPERFHKMWEETSETLAPQSIDGMEVALQAA